MAGKIFFRERRKVEDGEKKPRYRVVAAYDCNLKIYTDHLRLGELEQLAKETKSELVPLKRGRKKEKSKK